MPRRCARTRFGLYLSSRLRLSLSSRCPLGLRRVFLNPCAERPGALARAHVLRVTALTPPATPFSPLGRRGSAPGRPRPEPHVPDFRALPLEGRSPGPREHERPTRGRDRRPAGRRGPSSSPWRLRRRAANWVPARSSAPWCATETPFWPRVRRRTLSRHCAMASADFRYGPSFAAAALGAPRVSVPDGGRRGGRLRENARRCLCVRGRRRQRRGAAIRILIAGSLGSAAGPRRRARRVPGGSTRGARGASPRPGTSGARPPRTSDRAERSSCDAWYEAQRQRRAQRFGGTACR